MFKTLQNMNRPSWLLSPYLSNDGDGKCVLLIVWLLSELSADLYYGGEAFSVEQPQSFSCPYCGKMGYTETSLQEHVTSEHAETSTEVVSTRAVFAKIMCFTQSPN